MNMGDLALIIDPLTGVVDFSIENGDLVTDNSLETAVIISTMSDARADASDDLPGEPDDLRGWWGDEFSEIEGDSIGGKRWLLGRAKMTPGLASDVEGYDRSSLQWMIDDGLIKSIDFEGEIRGEHFGSSVVLHHVEGSTLVNVSPAPRQPIAVPSSVPVSVAQYEAIGFPAPTAIWDMSSSSVPFAELVDGSPELEDESGNSAGWIFEQASGLPNGEVVASRTTTNTSRALSATPNTFMDLDGSGQVAVGMMVRFSAFGSDNIVANKRATDGWNCRVSASGMPYIFGRPDTGGDITVSSTDALSVDTWHYLLFVLDHDTAKLFSVFSDVGSASGSSAGKGSFSEVLRQFGFDTSNAGQTDIAALAVWEGASVESLTSGLPAAFLSRAGA